MNNFIITYIREDAEITALAVLFVSLLTIL